MGRDRRASFRQLSSSLREKLPLSRHGYFGGCEWCKKHRPVEGWNEPDSSNFEEIQEENLSKPDHVTTTKPRLASASLRACSERGSEFDIQEKLSKPDHVTTSTLTKQLRSSSKMRKAFPKRKKLVMIKPTN